MTHPGMVLAGGFSHERDVSLRSGRRAAEALRWIGMEVVERDVDARLLAALVADPPTCVVPMLHGENGEDGAIREVLELLGCRTSAGPGRLSHRVRQARGQVGGRAGRHRHTRVTCACPTTPSASSARPR